MFSRNLTKALYSKTTFLLAGICLSALLGEIFLRLIAPNIPSIYSLVNVKTTALKAQSIEEFTKLNAMPAFKDWRGYYTNSWGMNDLEFDASSADNRIFVLGDSQTYGMVPYWANNISIAEDIITKSCQGKAFELFNLGVPGAGLLEYKKVFELTHEKLRPQTVLLNFYMGNDSPDVYRSKANLYPVTDGLNKSYFYTFVRNSFIALSGVSQTAKQSSKRLTEHTSEKVRGGNKTGTEIPASDNDPAMTGPTFTGDEWQKVARFEVNTLYTGSDSTAMWNQTYHVLDEIKEQVEKANAKLIIAFYPSEAQVDPKRLSEAVGYVESYYNRDDLSQSDYDNDLPQKKLKSYCEMRKLACLDLTPSLKAEFLRTGETLYIRQDTHLNLKGNRHAGEALGRFLNKILCTRGSDH